MVARVNTVAFQRIDVVDVDVQVQVASGLPAFSIVGLPDKAIGESRERVRAALNSLGLGLPPRRITVNLAPADLAKEVSHFDLPIALGLLAAMDVLPAEELAGFVAMGELALDGRISRVTGVLPSAIHAHSRELGFICPAACGGEAAWVKGLEIIAPPSLMELINHFKGHQVLAAPLPTSQEAGPPLPDLADIKGQETAKRALDDGKTRLVHIAVVENVFEAKSHHGRTQDGAHLRLRIEQDHSRLIEGVFLVGRGHNRLRFPECPSTFIPDAGAAGRTEHQMQDVFLIGFRGTRLKGD